jgi:hypothetical protein
MAINAKQREGKPLLSLLFLQLSGSMVRQAHNGHNAYRLRLQDLSTKERGIEQFAKRNSYDLVAREFDIALDAQGVSFSFPYNL